MRYILRHANVGVCAKWAKGNTKRRMETIYKRGRKGLKLLLLLGVVSIAMGIRLRYVYTGVNLTITFEAIIRLQFRVSKEPITNV